MKIKHLLFIAALIFLGWQQLSAGNPGGNLIISATGTSSTLPVGDFITGIGERGHNYTLTAADLTTLITNANGQLTLTFDNITISGNVVLDLSGCNRDINLTLLTDKYASGTIQVTNGGGLSIITATNKTSEITLLAGNMTGVANIKADKVTIADRTVKYNRIYMPGFTNWTQTQIDKLINTASHIGPSITDLDGGYKMYDFTTNTKFTVANGVFTMTAQADFTGNKGMGFKNMDREGTLAGQALGAYPANFFNDLTNAEGIRFKVDVKNGTAGTLNIGLSNCATAMFEYFINGIPLTAADEDGYITLPLSLFKKEFWSNEGLQLNNCKVFIIEIINVTNGTSVSFSDFHAYKTATAANQSLTLGGVALDENAKEVNITSSSGITQHTGQTFSAKGNININAEDKVTMNNDGNSLLGNINIQSRNISLTTQNTESSEQTAHFTFKPVNSSLRIYDVYVDNESKGPLSSYDLVMKDQSKHTIEVKMAASIDTAFTITGNTSFCEGTTQTLTATNKTASYQWVNGSGVISTENHWEIPATYAAGTYSIFVVATWYDEINDYTISNSKEIILNIFAASETALSDSIIYGNSYKKNGFDVTPTEVGISEHTLTLTNAHGCDSTVTLTLKTLPIPIDTTLIVSPTGDISLCEGNATSLIATSTADKYEWYLNGDKVSSDEIRDIPNNLKPNDYTIRLVATWTPDGSPATTLTREIALRINRVDLVDIKDTITLGETYKDNGFEITPTEVGTSKHTLTVTNAVGCDSIVNLLLTTLPVPIDTTLVVEGETTLCEGNSTTLTATSTADTYAWYFGEQPLSDSSSVVIPDTMAVGEYTISLIASWHPTAVPEDVISVTRTIELVINKVDHVEISDTVNVGETYDKNGFNITPTEAGTTDHTLTLTNAAGCDSVVVLHLTAIIPEGIHEYDIVRRVYPNPTTNYITVQVSSQAVGSEMRLYDMQGRLMKVQIIDNEAVRIDMTSFANGVYLLKANSQTVKIIKQ